VGRVPLEATASDLLRRPELNFRDLLAPLGFDADRAEAEQEMLDRAEEAIKYGDFIRREAHEVERHAKLESRSLPSPIDYPNVPGLRFEAGQKLTKHQPVTFGDARRLSGVTPSDIAALLIHATRLEAAAR
jgi:tRNA uridine 5-carboxymethylaminomethyl modification enzyme